MCGICGFVSSTAPLGDPFGALDPMIALMGRRGPDSGGRWTDGLNVALGFRRLAIIDPSEAGSQPVMSDCRRHVLVFNGEVYNFKELRRLLRADGFRFRSEADSEVVLNALIRWRETALEKFSGMFALAWYDADRRELLLARDGLGIKPLYFLHRGNRLVFASQYNQLFVHPWFEGSQLRPDVLALYLRLGHVPAPYGLFDHTHQLTPGHYLVFQQDGTAREGKHYRLPDPAPELHGDRADSAVESALRASVREQLVSDVPLGVLLSGGVDSPLIAGLARQEMGCAIPAFTIASPDPRLDESEKAAEYARAFQLEHHVLTFDDNECLKLIPEAAAAYGEPFADPSSLPTLIVSKFAASFVKVVLSGDGADELFWGYPRFAKMLGVAQAFRYPRSIRAAMYAASRLTGGSLPSGVRTRTLGEWHFAAHTPFSSTRLAAIAPGAKALPSDFAGYREPLTACRAEVAQVLRRNELDGHLHMILAKFDRASMHYGLEVRVPMLAPGVVHAAFAMRPEEGVANGASKSVLRRLLARLAPRVALETRKRGFDVPLGDWLRTSLRPVVEDLLIGQEPYPSGVFSRVEIRRLFDEHLQRRADHATGLWHLLALQLWADSHLKAIPQPRAEAV